MNKARLRITNFSKVEKRALLFRRKIIREQLGCFLNKRNNEYD